MARNHGEAKSWAIAQIMRRMAQIILKAAYDDLLLTQHDFSMLAHLHDFSALSRLHDLRLQRMKTCLYQRVFFLFWAHRL